MADLTMSRGARWAAIGLLLLTMIVGGANLAATYLEVRASNHTWCATLDLLTSRPVPRPADPAANPSREQTYVLFTDFTDLRHHLGCG
jgi:hypothetical protein